MPRKTWQIIRSASKRNKKFWLAEDVGLLLRDSLLARFFVPTAGMMNSGSARFVRLPLNVIVRVVITIQSTDMCIGFETTAELAVYAHRNRIDKHGCLFSDLWYARQFLRVILTR